MNVYITNYPEEQAKVAAERLMRLYDNSDKRHSLVSDPDLADIILVGGHGNEITEQEYLTLVMDHDILSRFPNKCFTFCIRDIPFALNRGIYESPLNTLWEFKRTRTGAYGPETFNPEVRRHEFAEGDYSGKKYLFSFIGRASHPIRSQLVSLNLKRQDAILEDSSNFSFWKCRDDTERTKREKHYYEVLKHSKFCLCPRGFGTSSIRLFESMSMGISPIIISDDWIAPKGPIWNEFSIIVNERDIKDLEQIASSYEPRYIEMGKLARKAYEDYFSDSRYFNYVVDNCLELKREHLVPESLYWRLRFLLPLSLRLVSIYRRRRHGLIRRLKGLRFPSVKSITSRD